MPFNNSYIDAERMFYADSRDYFRSLASRIVKEPVTTHIVKTSRRGKTLFLVIDRNIKPKEGSLVVIETMSGYKVTRYGWDTTRLVWGTITWMLRQG